MATSHNPLPEQLAALLSLTSQLHDAIPVEKRIQGISMEKHSPDNKGYNYLRIKAPRGGKLPNGNRTMRLQPEEVEEWRCKLYARNQQNKVAQCIALLEQANEIASTITWDFGDISDLVNNSEMFTKKQAEHGALGQVASKPKAKSVKKSKAKPKIKQLYYVFKNATNATPMNRRVHAISEPEPDYGAWRTPALCGDKPTSKIYGWERTWGYNFSCRKCATRAKQQGYTWSKELEAHVLT